MKPSDAELKIPALGSGSGPGSGPGRGCSSLCICGALPEVSRAGIHAHTCTLVNTHNPDAGRVTAQRTSRTTHTWNADSKSHSSLKETDSFFQFQAGNEEDTEQPCIIVLCQKRRFKRKKKNQEMSKRHRSKSLRELPLSKFRRMAFGG